MATYYLEQLSKNGFAPDPKLAEFIVTYAQAPAFSFLNVRLVALAHGVFLGCCCCWVAQPI